MAYYDIYGNCNGLRGVCASQAHGLQPVLILMLLHIRLHGRSAFYETTMVTSCLKRTLG